RFCVASAPFLFDDLEEADEVFNGEGGEMLEEILAEKGVKALGYGENGFRHITNSIHPIKGPIDLEGLKIRIQGTTTYSDLFKEFGSDPSTMTFSEVFTALQQG